MIKKIILPTLISITLFSCNKRLYVKSEIEKDQTIRHYQSVENLAIQNKMLYIQQLILIKSLKDSVMVLQEKVNSKKELIKKL